MDATRLKAEHVLYGLGLYGPARALYRLTPSGRRAANDRVRKRAFYSRLVGPGDLVFDVGANLGNYAEIFASLGAQVVALEPNPDCVSHIRRSYPRNSIDVVNTAVGSSPGVATIRIAQRSDMSSMSSDWIDAIRNAQRLEGSVWADQLTVPVITLDSLIEKFGPPKYIKIDVEGFEENVLAGLSALPELLSFEFNTNFLNAAFRCLDRMPRPSGCRFNFVIGEPFRLELDEWVEAGELREKLQSLPPERGYGDIFVQGSPSVH
jgi:FkbM family methyltransferase